MSFYYRLRSWWSRMLVCVVRALFWTRPSEAFAHPLPSSRRGRKLWVIAAVFGTRAFVIGIGRGTPNAVAALDTLVGRIRYLLPDVLLDTWAGGFIGHRAIGWVIVALCAFAMFTSYCLHGRDRYGYNAVAVVAGGWLATYLFAPLADPRSLGVWVDNWSYALVYGLIVYLVLYCAKDPELPHAGDRWVTSADRWRWRL